jgi:hypothetical protein
MSCGHEYYATMYIVDVIVDVNDVIFDGWWFWRSGITSVTHFITCNAVLLGPMTTVDATVLRHFEPCIVQRECFNAFIERSAVLLRRLDHEIEAINQQPPITQ